MMTHDSGEIRLALFDQHNVILMVGALALSLAFYSAWPLVVGLGGEVIYLTLAVRSTPVRRWLSRQGQARRPDLRRALSQREEQELEPRYRGRIEATGKRIAELRTLAVVRGLDPRFLDSHDRLERLLGVFKRMALVHQNLTRYLAELPVTSVTGEIARLNAALNEESDEEARASLAQAAALAQRRLRQHGRNQGRRRALEVSMATIEGSLDYIRSHLLGGGPPGDLVAEVDQVLATALVSPAMDSEHDGTNPGWLRHTIVGLGE
jgi:hypothetical protein